MFGALPPTANVNRALDRLNYARKATNIPTATGPMMGYGGVAFSPTGGGLGVRRPGVAFRSPVNSAPRMTPDAMRQAQASATASLSTRPGYGSSRTMPRGTRGSPLTRAPIRKAPPPAPATTKSVAASGEGGLRSLTKNKKGLAIGAGAAVIAGLAYAGRRGDGSSGGRTSMYRY